MFSSFYPLVFPPYDKFKFIENLKTFRSSLLFNQSSFYWQKAFRFLVKSQHLYIVQSPLPSNYCLNFLMQNVVKCAGCRLWCEGPGKNRTEDLLTEGVREEVASRNASKIIFKDTVELNCRYFYNLNQC